MEFGDAVLSGNNIPFTPVKNGMNGSHSGDRSEEILATSIFSHVTRNKNTGNLWFFCD